MGVSITAHFFSQKKVMTQRSTCWSLTINNPTKNDDEFIALARQKSGWKVHGQKEKGENGTEHYQLMLTTPQVRFSAVKKAFPRAHIEIARDKNALMKYVTKEDTRVGDIVKNDKFPTLNAMWDLFADWICYNDKSHMFYDSTPEGRLVIFDKFIRDSIDEDYHVELHAVNPQVRACVKHYGENILNRSLRRQTDRQTSENKVEGEDITNAESTEEQEESTCDSYEAESGIQEASSRLRVCEPSRSLTEPDSSEDDC